MGNEDYAYAVGKIRALETQLLTKSDFERLLETSNATSALQELSDTPYGEHLIRIKDISEYELLLNEELKKTHNLIKELSLHPEITDLFFLEKDLHNLKVLLKSKYAKISSDENLIDLGLFRLAELKEMVEKNDYLKFTNPTIRETVIQTVKQFELTHEPELIDFVLDAGMYEMLLDAVRKHQNIFLERFFQLQIDLTNLKTLVRFIVTKKDKRYFKDVLIHGGNLAYEFFLREFPEKEQDVPRKVGLERYENIITYQKDLNAKERRTPILEKYEQIISAGIKSWVKERSFSLLEKLIDNCLTEYLKKAKYITLGLEPLIAYLFAKETETKNIRIIILGKLNKVPQEILRERLRETYV